MVCDPIKGGLGRRLLVFLGASALLMTMLALAEVDAAPKRAGGLASLRSVPTPTVPGLIGGSRSIVKNPEMAIALGKALFWDIQVGSDQTACGTCHFQAGADGRLRNQLGRPQAFEFGLAGPAFDRMPSGRQGGVDFLPRAADFPFTQFEDPADHLSPLKFTTDNVMGSAGTFHRHFIANGAGSAPDECRADESSHFRLDRRLTRQVGYRNTPTVINAVFNYRNFWDGRANWLFNGETPWGSRDLSAGVWVVDEAGKLIKRRLLLPNASLASQAVAPILNGEEMACEGRRLIDVARRVLPRKALQSQEVAPTDSVLGALRNGNGLGLHLDYAEMIQAAFSERYWKSRDRIEGDLSQLEANFAFFFGLSIQLYESTLVSDQSPFDSRPDATGYPRDLTEAQRHGLDLFVKNLCSTCHAGPDFTLAVHPDLINRTRNPNGPQFVDRMVINGVVPGLPAKDSVTFTLFDRGFANTSVVPTSADVGLGGTDPYGNPYGFSAQYVQVLRGERSEMVDPVKVFSCDFLDPFTLDYAPEELRADPFVTSPAQCRKTRSRALVPSPEKFALETAKPGAGRAHQMVRGAFKIPTLRNVELTGPYMHNGGMKSLDEVLEFYSRAGNINNEEHFATLVVSLGLTKEDRADLVAFLNSLTDDRVRFERAPFDHPSIDVPEGIQSNGEGLVPQASKDRFVHIPAIGREGRSLAQGPLRSFEERLQDASY